MTEYPEDRAANTRRFPVAVVLERRPATSPWAEYVWAAAGITVGGHACDGEPQLIRDEQDVAFFLVGGLEVVLHVDECESYYHNIICDSPRAYVIAHGTPGGQPRPFMISMSFDEAHSYLEGDDEIYAVDVPGELYQWTEAYIIANYFPEKKKKRKLHDWKADGAGAKPA